MKYSWKFKLDCVLKYKKGEHVNHPVDRNRTTFMNHVREWTKRYDDLGVDGLRHSNSNKTWTPEKRFELVAKVLAGNSITCVARDAHIDNGQLYQRVRKREFLK